MSPCNNSTSATVLSDMTVVNNETRKQLMDKVPYRTEGNTCIGCGLQYAMNVTFSLPRHYSYSQLFYSKFNDTTVKLDFEPWW